jgi:hypothetical protein
MTFEQFRVSLENPAPPAVLSPLLVALWWDGKGDWSRGHQIAQSEGEQGSAPRAAWVHAYLHRKEGDVENARYWYRQARQPVPETTFDEEWRQIVLALLNRQQIP